MFGARIPQNSLHPMENDRVSRVFLSNQGFQIWWIHQWRLKENSRKNFFSGKLQKSKPRVSGASAVYIVFTSYLKLFT